MKMASREYVEKRNGGYYIAGTRVSLDSIVYDFLRGESPESIADSFPVELEQVYGAITFYLANRPTIDRYLEKERAEFEKARQAARKANPLLHAKLEAARRSLSKPRA